MYFNESITINYPDCAWVAPPINQLNFSRNCSIVAAFARTWLTEEIGVSDKAAAVFFRQALPVALRHQPTDGQLIDWYHTLGGANMTFMKNATVNRASKLYQGVIGSSFDACLDQVCKSISWSGVPDILGPGVMISSWIQAVLSTLLPVLLIWKMRLNRRGITPSRKLRWVFELQNTITGVFINTCILLNFTINIAAIVVIARRKTFGESTQVTLAFQLAVFCVYGFFFLTMIPAEMYDASDEEHPFPLIILYTNLILYLVLCSLAAVTASFEYVNSPWEVYCSLGIITKARLLTFSAMFVFGLEWLLEGIIFTLGPRLFDKCNCPGAAVAIRSKRRAAKWVFIWTAGLIMWCMLILITVLRQLLLEKSGYNSEDSDWSYGQVLALGTFLPFVIEILYVCKDGFEETIQGRVPPGWVVVKAEKAAALDMSSNALLPIVSNDD
ncbi:uncharacterized protein B0J16DRAFT_410505 [Fusarium flagelliforme]|uniref:uncharacterized protein n=1 Tax=Fusarium flagelliforme TaxID=2675880 RepID=UPI001E8E5BF3|nr:uncharacterized protein B0J16DRAFT_419428 [Fusarium flagelliforme]XP_045990771.1 uncharacterized protein B0J16DRAFT_410505 [Fusarium flagelliforme]KAH7169636.1 hypothetical protein B0J16DRAFT_419428 [Fusarium flagelliforme]KAH7199135.1 hypothetical protein B0J16DRAFT_410505 [Fusarium flagelliforme]